MACESPAPVGIAVDPRTPYSRSPMVSASTSGRYVGLIEVLLGAGLVVYGNDHRGHGRSAPSPEQFGDFGEGGFNLLVDDMVRLTRIAKEENPEKPLILLWHSMGSFAAQQYILDHSESIDGVVLSGSGALDRLKRLANSRPAGGNVMSVMNPPSHRRVHHSIG